METDFYTMQYFGKRLEKRSFFEVQRLAFPLLKEENISDNPLSYTLLSNYEDRLSKIDDETLEMALADFIEEFDGKTTDEKKISNIISKLPYEELIYLNDLIEVTLYSGKTNEVSKEVSIDYFGSKLKTKYIREDGKPYIHYEYDKMMREIIKMIKLEVRLRYSKVVLSKYGIDDFESLTYDDFSDIMTSMAINGNDNFNSSDYSNTEYARLFFSLSEIMKIYNDYSLGFDLKVIDFNKLSIDKLRELNQILRLSLELIKYGINDLNYSAFMVVRNSDVVIDIQRLDEAISICESNSKDIIEKTLELLNKELGKRNDRFSIRRKIKDGTEAMHENMVLEISKNKVLKK